MCIQARDEIAAMTLNLERSGASLSLIAHLKTLLRSRSWRPVAILMFAGIAWSFFREPDRPAELASTNSPAIPVGVATAKQMDFPVSLSGLGTVTPLVTVTVKTQIAGRITKIGFEEGQMVKEGDC